MKAKIIPNHTAKFNTSHRKDNSKVFFSSMSIISRSAKPWADGRVPEAISLRLYGTGNKNYACLWVNAEPFHTSGSGSAGGYGYHRPSAAAQEAITNAGFELDKRIDGVGETAMREALFAIAKAVGVKRPVLVESYA